MKTGIRSLWLSIRSKAAVSGSVRRIVTALIVLITGSQMSAQTSAAVQAPWEKQGLREELVSKRTRNAKHFIKEGQANAAFISPSSIHYLGAQGSWEEISTTVVASGNGLHPYKAEQNSVKNYFPGNPFTTDLVMRTKEADLSERISAIQFIDANGKVLGSVSLSGQVKSQVNGNKISYSGFCNDLHLDYALSNDARKFDLVIEDAKFFNNVPSGATAIEIVEQLRSKTPMTLEPREQELWLNIAGTSVLGITRPLAFDNDKAHDNLVEGKMVISEISNGYELKTRFDLAWLKDGGRVFPIHLDPTVNYYPQNVTMWTGNQSSSAGKTSGMLRLTTNTTSSWAKFDLATLPAGASVTQATYYGYHYSTTGAAKIAEIRGLQNVDPVTAAAAALFTQIYNGPVYNSNYTFGAGTYQWQPGPLNNAGLSDIAAAAGNWIGLGFGYVSGLTTFMYQYGINGTAAQMCYLEVVYFTVPCQGVPASNTILPVSFTTCPGITNPTLALASTYSVMGITYQWQSSTVSPVGPFTTIPGYSLSTAPVPTLGVNTWFQAIVTCTNGMGAITISPTQFFVQGVTTSSVPYYEDFEGIQINDRLPNCSWSAANLGSTVRTFTAPQSNNAVPKSGNKFALFEAPTTNDIVYTNGIQMEPGITYSAALWYATEYTGANNWTSLEILVGPNQSTTGLVQVASISPAVSGAHKLLSNVFTVPASGLYYVAIRATGSSGNALYLSWDDLSVTIPCTGAGAVNTPTLNLSASNNTVCFGQQISLSVNGADTYYWGNQTSGPVLTDIPNTMPYTVYTVLGTNTLTGCMSSISHTVFVNPSPSVYAVADKHTICAGTSAQLSAIGALTYVWSNNQTGNNIVVNPNVTSTYTVVGVNAYGCTGQGVVMVTVLPKPVLFLNSSGAFEICEGEEVTLSATGANNIQWINTSNGLMYAGTSINVTLNGTSVFNVTATNANGCVATGSITQQVVVCPGIRENKGSFFQIFPNPASEVVTITFRDAAPGVIELHDVTGRLVLTADCDQKQMDLDISALAPGCYYLRAGEGSARIIKQ